MALWVRSRRFRRASGLQFSPHKPTFVGAHRLCRNGREAATPNLPGWTRGLPERNRLAFVLSIYAGMPIREIAALTIGDVVTAQSEVRREIMRNAVELV